MASYVIGQHGAKRREQRRLTEMYGERVTGRTMNQSTPLDSHRNETSGTKRGGSKIIRQLEKDAWAYQEEKPLHRAHIGTGTQNTPDLSGFNGDTYRETQRTLVEQGHISSAVQVNQLAYAFIPGFQGAMATARSLVYDSFRTMVSHMDKVQYAQVDVFRTAPSRTMTDLRCISHAW